MEAMTEAEARYIQRLPSQLEAALRKVKALQVAHARHRLPLDQEAQLLLHEIYGPIDPGAKAEAEFQRRRRRA
jgi:hypothetical protein